MVNMTRSAEAREILLKLEAQGFSQVEIGRRTGISRGQVYNILRQRTGAGPKSIKAATTSERISDPMFLLRDWGGAWIEPANWRSRSLIGDYWNAVKKARENNDWTGLQKFKNKTIAVIDKGKRERMRFVTNPNELRKLEDQNQLEPDHIGYRRLKQSVGVTA